MSTILNIESSGTLGSVALTMDGCVEFSLETQEPMRHAIDLAPFVAHAMEEVTRKELKLDAVAVSLGPGSYTGLRIGLSLAKGLVFGLDIPLIGINTLELIAVKAMFRNLDWQGDEILIPMIDARRMEVYTAAYDFSLNHVLTPQTLIVTPDSFDCLNNYRKIYFIGDGAPKTKDIIKAANGYWLDGITAHAGDMIALSEKAFREGKFIDPAYSVPKYIKEYKAVVGENPLKQLLG